MAEEPLYVCPCGFGPKPFFSAMGHRGRSKNPLCKTGDLRLVSGSAPAREGAEAPSEAETASEPSASEAPPVAALGMQAAREPSPQLEPTGRDNGHVPINQPRDGGEIKETVKRVTPSTVKPAVVLPMTTYIFFDAWRAHFGYEGDFNDWVAEIVDHYMDLAGFELTITARPTARLEEVAV